MRNKQKRSLPLSLCGFPNDQGFICLFGEHVAVIYAVERVLSTMQSLPAAPLPTLPPLNKQHSDASPPRTVLDSRSTAPQASVCTHRSLHADAEYLPSTQWCSSPPDSVHDGLPRHTPTAVVHTAVDNTVGMLIRRLLKVQRSPVPSMLSKRKKERTCAVCKRVGAGPRNICKPAEIV